MTTITAHPLCWPTGWSRTQYRTYARFTNCTFTRARTRLALELERLKATDIILSTNVPLRVDGNPYGTYREPNDPGVAVYFTLRGKPMAMARDAFSKTDWNLNSLAMAVEHLRGLERHGGATMMERAFTGFTALPDPATPRIRPWREVLGLPLESPIYAAHIDTAYRALAMERHPDKGGSDEQMAELNRAREEGIAAVAEGQGRA